MQINSYVSGPAQAKTFPWTCKCHCTISSGALGVHSAWVQTLWHGVAALSHPGPGLLEILLVSQPWQGEAGSCQSQRLVSLIKEIWGFLWSCQFWRKGGAGEFWKQPALVRCRFLMCWCESRVWAGDLDIRFLGSSAVSLGSENWVLFLLSPCCPPTHQAQALLKGLVPYRCLGT